MDRPSALALLNGRILTAYSARTIRELRDALPLRIALPHLEPILALNVQKEIRKDTLVIRRTALAHGIAPDADLVRRLFVETKAIDDAFVTRVRAFPLRVVIPYAEIEPLRMQRIERLMEAAGRILAGWRAHIHLRTVLHETYTQYDFERVVRHILDLYARETRALTRSVRLPLLLEPLRAQIAGHLFDVMERAGTHLAADLGRGIYRCPRSGAISERLS